MKYIVTKEIKSEIQIAWFIYLQDAAFLVVWCIFILTQREKVHSILQIPYILFSIIVGIRFILPSKENPKRRYFQSVALYLIRPKKIKRYFKEVQEDEEKRDQSHQRRHTYHRV